MIERLKFPGYQIVWGTAFGLCVFLGLWLWSTW